jgi:ribonucleoside-diphosphate reductase alpha chain
LDEIYTTALEMGLKTTYYLRTMAVSQIEKSTLDAMKYFLTQKRNHPNVPISSDQTAMVADAENLSAGDKAPAKQVTNFKDILDTDCEVCT